MIDTTNKYAIQDSEIKPEDIHLPPNSFWPIILAFGFTLIIGGAAIHWAMAIAGVVITLVSAIGWVIEPVHSEEAHH